MLGRAIVEPDTAADEEDSEISLADILADAGLLQPGPNDLRSALNQHRPEAVLAVIRRSDGDELAIAMAIAEAYAEESGALLFASQAHRDRWRLVEDALTEEQRDARMPPLPDEGEFRPEGNARQAIEGAAIDTARISLSIERTILRLLHELE
jgi:hypothetical protein